MSTARTPYGDLPGPAGSGRGEATGAALRVAGAAVRFTPGAFVLALGAAVLSVLSLPEYAQGRPAWAYLAAAAGIAVAILGSLALHEIGHILTLRRRARPAEVLIGFAGGHAHGTGPAASPGVLGRAAVAGPLVSLLVAVAAGGGAAGLAASGADELLMVVLAAIAAINAAIGVLSLLPGAGPDGTRLVRALAWARTGDSSRAALVAAKTGRWTGGALAVAGVVLLALGFFAGLWVALIGVLAFTSSRSEVRRLRVLSALAGFRVGDVIAPLPAGEPGLAAWQTVSDFIAARDEAAAAGGPEGLATAFALRTFDGAAVGLLTLSQLAGVPADRRDDVRLRDVATPVAQVATASAGEPLASVVGRLRGWPANPAAAHTLGHALVLAADGSPAGVLTPADLSRATQLGWLRRGDRTPADAGGAA